MPRIYSVPTKPCGKLKKNGEPCRRIITIYASACVMHGGGTSNAREKLKVDEQLDIAMHEELTLAQRMGRPPRPVEEVALSMLHVDDAIAEDATARLVARPDVNPHVLIEVYEANERRRRSFKAFTMTKLGERMVAAYEEHVAALKERNQSAITMYMQVVDLAIEAHLNAMGVNVRDFTHHRALILGQMYEALKLVEDGTDDRDALAAKLTPLPRLAIEAGTPDRGEVAERPSGGVQTSVDGDVARRPSEAASARSRAPEHASGADADDDQPPQRPRPASVTPIARDEDPRRTDHWGRGGPFSTYVLP